MKGIGWRDLEVVKELIELNSSRVNESLNGLEKRKEKIEYSQLRESGYQIQYSESRVFFFFFGRRLGINGN